MLKKASSSAILFLFFIFSEYELYKTIQNESNINITLTVKSVMLDHVNLYILQPLTEYFVEITQFLYFFPFITANCISYLGVIFALVAARLVLNDNLLVRRLGVIAFFVRQFMDDLDGYIARYHLGIDIKKHVSVTNSSGYIVDGICDGIGTMVFWYATFRWAYLRKPIVCESNILHSDATYTLLENNIQHSNNNYQRKILKYYVLLLIQIALSSLLWNIFLNQYHETLDPSLIDNFQNRTFLQEEIFKSSLTYMTMFLWRCLNPHALTNYFLISVWLNRATHYAKISSQYNFYMILCLSFWCMIHLIYIKYLLSGATFMSFYRRNFII